MTLLKKSSINSKLNQIREKLINANEKQLQKQSFMLPSS